MRVIEPHQLSFAKMRTRSRVFIGMCFGLLAISAGGGWYFYTYYFSPQNHGAANTSQQSAKALATVPETAKKGTIKNFSGEQFRDLYNGFAYPNTQKISEKESITGNLDADARIRAIAVQRGYSIRSAPVQDAFIEVEPGLKLQQRAADGWNNLKTAAAKDGIALDLTAAFRSADEQKSLFLNRLRSNSISIVQIGTGRYDAQISEVLRTTALPGYSRHHTGYTVDISCPKQLGVTFEASACFEWLNRDNYKNAKFSGWIPSYPPGAGQQGPDPEPWEYVWVGTDTLKD